MPKRIKVTVETGTGRNIGFYDNYKKTDMTDKQFVRGIENGEYPNYHIRIIDGIKTPASNPDSTKNNNLDD
ncbi:DUF3892 domain-containing protein [Candidatus Electrothrix aarhusensis]